MSKPVLSIVINQCTTYLFGFDPEEFVGKVLRLLLISHGSFEFSFVTNETILEINRTYLQHDYETDIITFNLGSETDIIGDAYISVDHASENAASFGNSLDDELKLLIVHGILHLLGYNDELDEDRLEMEAEQNRILSEL